MARPPFYSSPEEMEQKINEYFLDKDEDNPPLIEELALFLGFANYKSLWNYAQKEEFSDIVTNGKNRCGMMLNKLALRNKVNSRIASLNLSANHNLHERKELGVSSPDGGPLSVSIEFVRSGENTDT